MSWMMLPPEVNSARMYAGAGAASLIRAASAWETLAVELGTTTASFSQVVAGLTGVWLGPSALSMQTVALRYRAWLMETTSIVHDTAARALAAAAAYEVAFAATVPPPIIAANRALLVGLTATNLLGINTAAIMATEAQYMEMWAQDVAAMSGYQAASTQAVQLTPFAPLAPLTTGAQASAVSVIQGTVQDALSALRDPTTGWAGLFNEYLSAFVSSGAPIDILSLFSSMWAMQGMNFQDALTTLGADPNSVVTYTPPLDSPTIAITPSPAVKTPPVSASMGTAGKAGSLSVPRSWTFSEASPSVSPISTDQALMIPPPLLGAKREIPEAARYGVRPKGVMSNHPSGG